MAELETGLHSNCQLIGLNLPVPPFYNNEGQTRIRTSLVLSVLKPSHFSRALGLLDGGCIFHSLYSLYYDLFKIQIDPLVSTSREVPPVKDIENSGYSRDIRSKNIVNTPRRQILELYRIKIVSFCGWILSSSRLIWKWQTFILPLIYLAFFPLFLDKDSEV